MIKTNKKMSVSAIIQARNGSTRLPGKAMLELSGKPLLYHVIERVKASEGIDQVILATAAGDENIPLIELANSMGARTYAGSPDNVLERFYCASEEFGGDFIVRVTGDNPFTDPHFTATSVRVAVESEADLCSVADVPLGTAVEVISKKALDTAYRLSSRPYHFEHVTPYIKENKDNFRIIRHPVKFHNPFKNLRLTVDTPEDFKLANIIYEALYNKTLFSANDVIEFLTDRPELVSINSEIIQRAMTHFEKNE